MSNYFYTCLYTVLCNCDPAVGVKYSIAGIVTTNYLFNSLKRSYQRISGRKEVLTQ